MEPAALLAMDKSLNIIWYIRLDNYLQIIIDFEFYLIRVALHLVSTPSSQRPTSARYNLILN